MDAHAWPTLPTDDWHDTLETFHLWTQVVGKIRLVNHPWLNHSWSVALYVTPTGLTTGLVPVGDEAVELRFDLTAPALEVTTSTGRRELIELRDGTSVAAFHRQVLDAMAAVGMPVEIDPVPNEIADAIPFPDDEQHATFDPDHARALHRAWLAADRVLRRFRAGFRGKASPVHLFWGSFDLAVTRFSGREAPRHPGGMPNFPDDVAAEAYSHEVTSVGFWPGNRESPTPIFYAYAYPTPDGFADATVQPDAAFWLDALGEFALPYDAVAAAEDPDATLLAFCQSTHAAAAELAGWDRDALECPGEHGPDWWAQRPHPPREPVARDDDAVVRDDPDRHRYVIEVDGADRGRTVYHRRGDDRIFVHTEVDDAYAGRGLASTLVRGALDDVRRQGGRIVALCPYVVAWLERHEEYRDLVVTEAGERPWAGAG